MKSSRIQDDAYEPLKFDTNIADIPKERLKDIYEIFAVLDKDKDGSISLQEMGNLLKTLRLGAKEEENSSYAKEENPNEKFVETEQRKGKLGVVPKELRTALSTTDTPDISEKVGETKGSLEEKIMALADVDRNGTIDFEEFARLADRELPQNHDLRASFKRSHHNQRAQDQQPEPEREVMGAVDDGEKEYLALLQELFSAFDADGDGYIDAGEIRRVLEAIGIDASDSDLRHMMERADRDGNDRIDFDEFVRMNRDRDERRPSSTDVNTPLPDPQTSKKKSNQAGGLLDRARRFFDCRKLHLLKQQNPNTVIASPSH